MRYFVFPHRSWLRCQQYSIDPFWSGGALCYVGRVNEGLWHAVFCFLYRQGLGDGIEGLRKGLWFVPLPRCFSSLKRVHGERQQGIKEDTHCAAVLLHFNPIVN